MLAHFIEKAGIWWMMPILLLAWIGISLSLERLWYWFRLMRRQRRSQPIVARLFSGDSPSAQFTGQLGNAHAQRDPTLLTLSGFLVNLFR